MTSANPPGAYCPPWSHIAAVASLPVVSALLLHAACLYVNARPIPAQPGDGDWAGLGVVWSSFALCSLVAITGILVALVMVVVRHRVSIERRSIGIAFQ